MIHRPFPVGRLAHPKQRAVGALAVLAFAASTGVVGASTEPPTEPAPAAGGNPAGCVDGVEPGTNLFPEQFVVEHAENFSLTYSDTYKVLTVDESSPGAGARTYVLVQCGTDAPALDGDLADATVVEIPIATMFSESTSHNGFIDVLDIEDTITGVADGSFVVTPSIRERIDTGEVDFFNTTGTIDTEVVVAAAPDVYVTGGLDDPGHDVITAAGVPVVANTEWLETSPEGWAEWVGLFAALTNNEATANALYAEWITDYQAAAALVESAQDLPTVITGGLFEGTWYANGGASIVAEFIGDAGGDYVFGDDTATGSIELDIETVLADGAAADVWVNASGFTTKADGLSVDSRYAELAAWENDGVWTNAVATDPTISFIEAGPVMIDEYLLDYISIFHPDLATDHSRVFFSAIAES